jgi:hypothetical protein
MAKLKTGRVPLGATLARKASSEAIKQHSVKRATPESTRWFAKSHAQTAQ